MSNLVGVVIHPYPRKPHIHHRSTHISKEVRITFCCSRTRLCQVSLFDAVDRN
jgi:hypothetical protein